MTTTTTTTAPARRRRRAITALALSLALAGSAGAAAAGNDRSSARGPCPAAEIRAVWDGGSSDDSRCDHIDPYYLEHMFYTGPMLTTAKAHRYLERTVFVQLRLRDLGYRPMTIDGFYGPEQTAPAVTRFQRNRGLYVDGKVGEQTWSALFGLGRA